MLRSNNNLNNVNINDPSASLGDSDVLLQKVVDFAFNLSRLLQSATVSDVIYFNNHQSKLIFTEFLTNPLACTIFIVKALRQNTNNENDTPSAEPASSGLSEPSEQFFVMNQLIPTKSTISTIVLLKEKGQLRESMPLDAQIQVLNLPNMLAFIKPEEEEEGNNGTKPLSLEDGKAKKDNSSFDSRRSYEMLKTLISLGISPYFEALTHLNSGVDTSAESEINKKVEDESNNAIQITKKKFNELALSLQHILQSVQVPDLMLSVHPVIRSAVEEASNTGKDPIEFVPKELVNDSVFLNQLQTIVNGWVKSAQDVSKLTRDPIEGTVVDEINFWSSIETALLSVQEQLKSKEIETTLTVLRNAKRFYATVSLLSDTGLQESIVIAKRYNQLLKDLPIDELLSASTFEKVEESIILIINHMKKLRVTSYPISRALRLVESISFDLDVKLKNLISQTNLMRLDFNDFLNKTDEINVVFATFDKQLKEFTNLARELLRKRSEKFIFIKINSKTKALKEKLDYLYDFRIKHNEMLISLSNIVSSSSISDHQREVSSSAFDSLSVQNPIEEMSFAFEAVESIDITDTTAEGKKQWDLAEKLYNKRAQKVENSITIMLRDILSKAKTTNEMFSIYNKFNFLLSKPSINTSIQEYQSKLLDIANEDIANLQNHFLKQNDSQRLFEKKDIQKISSIIIWARQIENRLNFLLNRLEIILGNNWNEYAEGQRIYSEAMVFKKKLNVNGIYEKWLRETSTSNLVMLVEEKIFKIVKCKDNSFKLVINFDSNWVSLFKEVRNLCYLNYQVPHQIITTSRIIRRVYPFVINLNESVGTLYRSLTYFEDLKEFGVLLHEEKMRLFDMLRQSSSIKWDDLAKAYDFQKMNSKFGQLAADKTSRTVSGRLANSSGSSPNVSLIEDDLVDNKSLKLVNNLETFVVKFKKKILALQSYKNKISELLISLTKCDFDFNAFNSILSEAQQLVDGITLENYNNVNLLVSKINDKVVKILTERLKAELTSINEKTLSHFLPKSVHELVLKDQTISILPSIGSARFLWIRAVQDLVNVVRKQGLIDNTNFDIFVMRNENKGKNSKDYTKALTEKNSKNQCKFLRVDSFVKDELGAVYKLINLQFERCEAYANSWFRFQALWDLQSKDVYDFLQKDINLWILVLNDIRRSRKIFDTVETTEEIGSVTFDYKQVQLRVNAKYDTWQRQMLDDFSDILANSMKQMDSELVTARSYLEHSNINVSSTNDTIQLISNVQKYKDSLEEWTRSLDLYEKGQILLVRNRFSFPSDWLHVEQIENDYSSLMKILKKRLSQIEAETGIIVKRVESESSKVENMMRELKEEWLQKKPISGSIIPSSALIILKSFESKTEQLQGQKVLLERASEVLLIPIALGEDLGSILEEIGDFKTVWSSLEILYNSLQNIKQTSWTNVVPRIVRRQLEELLATSRGMPTKVRQYSAFEQLQNNIKTHIKENLVLSYLKSDAMKVRHWNELYNALSKDPIPASLQTLGNVYDLQLTFNEVIIKEIIAKANGEKTLEDSLDKIKETWGGVTLDLFNYQGRCRLIKSWDKLFNQCSDDIDVLAAMRHSTFYSIFEQEANGWETKLNKLYVLLDTWIDVQRQWVYLDGVFGDNTDIKRLLPIESSRFQNITSEFFRLLKTAYKSPFVIDLVSLDNIQPTMEKYLEILARVRKALGDYLEKQREYFSRFYFIGNDDLLNIIGNSDNPTYIGNHLNKIYANIDGIDYDGKAITAIYSKEREKVELFNPVILKNHSSLVEWLKELEYELKQTLSTLVEQATNDFINIVKSGHLNLNLFLEWMKKYPCQPGLLAIQICWTQVVEEAIKNAAYKELQETFSVLLNLVSSAVMEDLGVLDRQKLEILIIELVHEYNVIIDLSENGTDSLDNFIWKSKVKYYINQTSDYLQKISVKIMDSEHYYGFEYQGLTPSLVRNDIIKSSFVNYNECLACKKGGCSFGPAGTGKTESVKEFGKALGRPVLVFNCDDSFDFTAISRILLGICQVGAWVCFDEFNRLDSKMLSAVSSQIEKIELGLSNNSIAIDLLGNVTKLSKNTSIFITMNPTYAGRSSLPENLKKLFRSFSVNKTNKEAIAEVILYSQGFKEAKEISKNVISLFNNLEKQLSRQTHYDFGLRAIKSTLNYCGKVKRNNLSEDETFVIYQGLYISVMPKLVQEDTEIFTSLMKDTFQKSFKLQSNDALLEQIEEVIETQGLVSSPEFTTKVLQLYELSSSHHGIMMVGDAGCGKSTVRNVLLKALQKMDGIESASYVINPKISKEVLYGSLDLTTREFKDGLFTSFLRKIVANLRGELSRRIWIVFDGDVDPEWIENLNSLLDDNKVFTLPSGEHIALPSNVKIVFETDSLKYATPATVSRCGMIWFTNKLNTPRVLLKSYINKITSKKFDFDEQNTTKAREIKVLFTEIIKENLLSGDSKLEDIIDKSAKLRHVFKYLPKEKLDMFVTIYGTHLSKLMIECSSNESVFDQNDIREYAYKAFLLSLFWAFAGDCPVQEHTQFNIYLTSIFTASASEINLYDQTISIPDMTWTNWHSLVGNIDIAYEGINDQLIIPTADTTRLSHFIETFVQENKFLLLCGPPGSGKTMTVLDCLRSSNRELISVNFSGKSSIEDLLSTLHQYCTYMRNSTGISLVPKSGKEVVCFIDEINLPNLDKYGSQPVIMFLRGIVEMGGFYSTDNVFVTLENVKFIGACNPATDQGRKELSPRFLSLCPVLFVDYPSSESLKAIYNSFAEQIFSQQQNINNFSTTIVETIISIYYLLRNKLTVLSPRDITRFMRSLFFGLENKDDMSLTEFLRLFVNEALRLFSDRIADKQQKSWIFDIINENVLSQFPNCDESYVFKQPILYSRWLSSSYSPVDIDEFRLFVSERLRVFSNEVLDTNLILYQDCLDHITRIDRVLSLPQGHLILVGDSTGGKTTLCRFVAWVNGLLIVQLAVHRNYTLNDFDATLRKILKRAGAYGEKICFIIDESNILESSFIERMNTLLANSEIPSLFSGNEFSELMSICLDQSQQQGLLLDTEEELYKWFTQQISKNLHVIFTINSPETSTTPEILSSPALLNRCVVNWMGDWSNETLREISSEMIRGIPVENRNVAIQALIDIHRLLIDSNKRTGFVPERVPGDFMDFLNNFLNIYHEKENELEGHQRHINVGLDKLRDTVIQVKDLKDELSVKQNELKAKDIEAKAMLDKMLVDQNEAERKQEASMQVQEALQAQEVEIAERKEIVTNNLDTMIPIIEAAAQNVKNIKKQNLSELRSMNNPPEAVKMTLEAVCFLIGFGAKTTWRDIQAITRRDDFIISILNFENNISPQARSYLENHYFAKPNFNLATVSRASKACGPLLAWIEAQVKYSAVLEQVDPLQNEVFALEESARENKAKVYAINEMLTELQESIEQYKENYSLLIREIENIKVEMKSVESKVKRSMALMESLTQERNRWSKVSFNSERLHLPGNCILSAAFLSYAGYYDQKSRSYMMKLWKNILTEKDIIFDPNLLIAEFLSTPSEILSWQENGLANDDLLVENMILIKDCKTVPFLIDPSGQMIEVLGNTISPKKLTIASFLDKGFVKQVENALRFGNSILIEDAEFFDPVISSILKKEFSNAGGRSLLKLNGQEIDCAQNFKLYLHTKNPHITVPSHIAGRTTIVNFTTTKSSLENKVLNLTLLEKEPEVEAKRQNLIKLNGEYKAHLRKLEDDLLVSLSSSVGNILDNDELIATLENLKQESKVILTKIEEAANVMATVEKVSEKYRLLAVHSSSIFSILHSFNFVNNLYQFSLDYFFDIFNYVLARKDDTNVGVKFYIEYLYGEVFKRTSISLKQEDRPVLGLSLLLVYLQSLYGNHTFENAQSLLETVYEKPADIKAIITKCLSQFDIPQHKLDTFRNSDNEIAFNELFDVPSIVDGNELRDLEPLLQTFVQLQSNPASFISSLNDICQPLTGFDIFAENDDVDNVFVEYTTATTPIILSSSEGYDPTFRIKAIAAAKNVNLVSVAMGSSEAIDIANQEIRKANKEGYWVLIQNAQMAPSWLGYLSKQLSTINASQNFRILLTCSLTSEIPTTLLRSSYVLIFESTPGLKTVLRDSFNSIPESKLEQLPVERRHLYFLLSWFHSVVQERSRFIPIGWKSSHDFNNTDFELSISIIDRVIDKISPGRVNVSPDLIPWEELQYMVGKVAYGGKVDNEDDFVELLKLTASIFNSKAFDGNFNLIENEAFRDQAICPPESRSIEAYKLWIDALPLIQPPNWIGMSDDVESILNIEKSKDIAKMVVSVTNKLDEF